MCHARDRQHAEYLASRVQCMKVKPRVIMHYVEHMIATYIPLYPHMEFDVIGSSMHAWDSMNDMEVPVVVRDNALCVETAYDAGVALNKYVGVRQGYANARPDVDVEVMAAADPAAMPSVELDFASETPVLQCLSHDVVTQVLRCYPFVLQLPERLAPDGVSVQAPSELVITDVAEFVATVQDLDSDSSLFYRQLDVHVKQVVRLHQLSENPMHRALDGVEEVQVVVDTGGAFEASLPRAFQEFAEEQDVHMDEAEASSETADESDDVVDIDREDQDVGENRSPDDHIADVLTGRAPNNAFIGVLAADAPPCPDFDRHFWIFTHPGAFPNGQGTYPEGMSFEWWAQRHLQRWPRRLTGQQPTLVLDMFNVKQRRAVLRSAHTVMKSNPALFRELADMPAEEIKVALELFNMKRKGHTYAQRLADAPSRVAKLLRAITCINVSVECTPSWYSGLRSRLIAHWHATGPLTAFPTFNCSELYSPACLELLGQHITYDQDGFGVPHDMPSVFERWKLVAADPVACAQYFDVYMHAVWAVLFGWPIDSPKQVNPNCLFGEVQSGGHRAECSGRAALHAHGMFNQPQLQPAKLRMIQQLGDDALSRLFKWLQSMSCKSVAPGWHLEGSADWAAPVGSRVAVDFSRVDASTAERAVGYKFPATYHLGVLTNPDSSDEAKAASIECVREYQARVVSATCVHNHSHRCQKGGRKGDDTDCAMFKPEHVREAYSMMPNGLVLPKCDHGMIVPHSPAAMLAEPCNQMIVFPCDGSRWFVQKGRAQAQGLPFPEEPPSIEMHSAQVSNYVTKYNSKPAQETEQVQDMLAVASRCVPVSRVGVEDASGDDDVLQGKQVGTKVSNYVNGRQVMPQSLAANSVLGHKDYHLSHQTAPYYPTAFAAELRHLVAPDLDVHVVDSKQMLQPVRTAEGMAYVGWVTDYLLRPVELRYLCAYFYIMFYQKILATQRQATAVSGDCADVTPMQSTRGRVKYMFGDSHPQVLSHRVVHRGTLCLPQAISNYPVRPDAVATTDAWRLYALSVLSMFVNSDMLHDLLDGGFDLLQILQAWEDPPTRCCCMGFDSLCHPLWLDVHGGWDTVKSMAADGHTLLMVLQCVQDKLGFVAAPLFSWHEAGHIVVANIQSHAAALEEDRQTAMLLRRDRLRRLHVQSDVPGADATDSESDLSDGASDVDDLNACYTFEPAPEATVDLVEPVVEVSDMVQTLLSNLDSSIGESASAYMQHALQEVPGIDFGSIVQQKPTNTAHISNCTGDDAPAASVVANAFEKAQLAQLQQHSSEHQASERLGPVYDLKGVGSVHVTRFDLVHPNTPGVEGRLEYLLSGGACSTEILLDPTVHGPPPTVKLPARPSIHDTIRLFTLSNEQAFSFVLLADALLSECQGQTVDPIRMVLTGGPGTGKSQVLKAFEWFCFQYDASDMLLVAAYCWRQSLVVANGQNLHAPPVMPSRSIPGVKGRMVIAADVVGPVRFIFLDEYSFISGKHLNDINLAVRRAKHCHGQGPDWFGNVHVILCGDLCQHAPVRASPLYADNTVRQQYNRTRPAGTPPQAMHSISAREQAGINLYRLLFDRVVFLQQSQRIRSDTDLLYANINLFISMERATLQVVTRFCDALNACAVTAAQLQELAPLVPRVVCLRNEVRMHMNLRLATLHARTVHERMLVWRSIDFESPGRGHKFELKSAKRVPQRLSDVVATLKPEDTKHIGGLQVYFPGCRYSFVDNVAAILGDVNNAECIGRGILVDPREQDDPSSSVWYLKYPPLAVFVEPLEGVVLESAHHQLQLVYPDLPPKCVPVAARATESFAAIFPEPLERRHTWNIKRWGIPLHDGYAVTDFYTEGMNFRTDCWLAHLCVPPDGNLKRAGVFVVLSRWGAWADVKLICPSWPTGDSDARARCIEAYHKIACLEPELVAELNRLKRLAEGAKVQCCEQWQRAVQATQSVAMS